MAKGKEVVLAIASIEFRYQSAADMPWERIEKVAKKTFSTEERSEIHHCADGFDWDFHSLSKAPPLREVEKLRNELLKHCDALVALARFHQPLKRDTDREPGTDVVSALQIHSGTENFDFRETFDALSREAAKVAEGLRERPNFERHKTSKTAETAGLREFLRRVIDGAEPTRARSTPAGRFIKDGLEYRRWGMSVGPRATGFAEFTGAVLSRHVTIGMLRKAWPSDF